MWILQVRAENDSLDTIYTCRDCIPDDDMKARFLDVLLDNFGTSRIQHNGNGLYSVIREHDNVILADMWQV